jgi:peptide/nickel transport system permease protein
VPGGPLRQVSFTGRAWRRFLRSRLGLAGGVIVFVLTLSALFSPWLATHDPAVQNLSKKLSPPGGQYWLGTDEFGRDIYSRLVYGARIELAVGLISVSIGLVLGTTLGIAAGLLGGAVDDIVMRTFDILLAFPYLLLAILIVSILGVGVQSTIIAVGLWATPGLARIIRGIVLSVRQQEYVDAARSVGASPLRIAVHHILPNCISVVVVYASLYTANAIILEAALSFLGLGVRPPTASWGLMISTGREYLFQAPHIATLAGLAISLAVLGFNLLADGLRDALDIKLST